ncbi:MAG: CubicO group peptidase (beta-lactamase class C family) [Alcanivorax sp.]|jgi:CubicO group peptidase (beta-lactamase class C family)
MSHDKQITTQNWGTPPNNRWSFQYMQALFPTHRLVRDSARVPFEYAAAEKDLQDLTYSRANGETGTIKQMIEDSYTDSFLLVKSGAIITEQYFNNMTPSSHHLINSVTKSFVGMLAGIAVERGLLDPEALITKYLPDLDNSAWEGATVRHLLDMTAGVNYHEEYAEPEADFWKESAVVGWRPSLVNENTPGTLYDYAKSLEGKDQENGSMFHYRTVTTNVIGMILEQVMHKGLGELLTDEIWSKLLPQTDANVIVDKAGALYVGAGMSACTRDLANFGMAMINDGQINGQQVLSAQWILDTIEGDATSRQCYLDSDYAALGLAHYRNQVWVKDREKSVTLALGIHGQIIYMDKSSDIVMVKLSTQPESVDLDMFVDAFAAMDAIAENLSA